MNKPYIDSISTKSESKYLLIVAAAKRARQITTNEPELTRSGKVNPVSQALHEINDDELTWEIGERSEEPTDIEPEDAAAELAGETEIAADGTDEPAEEETPAEEQAEEE